MKRNTLGEFWFVASRDPLRYAMPLLALTVAATAAALIGEEHGRLRLERHLTREFGRDARFARRLRGRSACRRPA